MKEEDKRRFVGLISRTTMPNLFPSRFVRMRLLLIVFAFIISKTLFADEVGKTNEDGLNLVQNFINELKNQNSANALAELFKNNDVSNRQADLLEMESKCEIESKTHGKLIGYNILSNKIIGFKTQYITCMLYYESEPVYATFVFYSDKGKSFVVDWRYLRQIEYISQGVELFGSKDSDKKYSDTDGTIPLVLNLFIQQRYKDAFNTVFNLSPAQLADDEKALHTLGPIQNIKTVYYSEIPDRVHEGLYFVSYTNTVVGVCMLEYKTQNKWTNLNSNISTKITEFGRFFDYVSEKPNK
jgi:hypothetical protein